MMATAMIAAAGPRPVVFIAYTVKGFGLPLAGHKDNHAGLLTSRQLETYRSAIGVREGHEWNRFEGVEIPETLLSLADVVIE